MPERLLVIGAGGHARSVIDIILQNGDYEIVGCIDNSYPEMKFLPGMSEIPVVGNDDKLQEFYDQGVNRIFVALGNNRLRAKLYKKAMAIGFEPATVVSRYAVISPRAKIGTGTCVMAGAVVNVNCVIGEDCIINTNCSLDHDCKVGSHCHVAPGCAVSGTVSLGDYVQLGTGTNVIDGISVGEGTFIGAGAAVVKDMPENILAYGVPARFVKKF